MSSTDPRPHPLRNISPNQFALPGMEEHAHPGARFLPKGVMFHHQEDKGVGRYTGDPYHSHFLYAHKMGAQFNPEEHHGNALGYVQWAGKESRSAHYPGEIEYVERTPGTPERHRGLMTAMYHMGHQLNMGQTTVPLHSPSRTPEGEAWSKKVGGPRPKRDDFAWKPPIGVHPYEHRNVNQQQFRPKGQQRLPGMGPTTGLR